MRITNKMMTNRVLNNINTNLERLEEAQKQLTTGTKISRPSDDPIATARVLSVNSNMKAQEQYQKNMEDAIGWLDTTDGALGRANDVLQRVRELAVYGANGTMSDDSRKALAAEVNTLVEEMVQIGNTNYAGRYIFGGSYTTEPPFTISSTDSEGNNTEVQFIDPSFNESQLNDTYNIEFEVEPGVVLNISTGKGTFHTSPDGNQNLNAVFEKMIELRENLEEGDTEEISARISDFDKLIDQILSERAVVGAKSKRMEVAKERSTTYQLDLHKLLGKLEDVDYAEAVMQYKVQQTVYQAALATGAQSLQPTLVEFLR